MTQLEDRLNVKKEQLLEKELVLEEVGSLSERLRFQAVEGREETLDIAKTVNEFQARIKKVTRRLMACVSELSMYQVSFLISRLVLVHRHRWSCSCFHIFPFISSSSTITNMSRHAWGTLGDCVWICLGDVSEECKYEATANHFTSALYIVNSIVMILTGLAFGLHVPGNSHEAPAGDGRAPGAGGAGTATIRAGHAAHSRCRARVGPHDKTKGGTLSSKSSVCLLFVVHILGH